MYTSQTLINNALMNLRILHSHEEAVTVLADIVDRLRAPSLQLSASSGDV